MPYAHLPRAKTVPFFMSRPAIQGHLLYRACLFFCQTHGVQGEYMEGGVAGREEARLLRRRHGTEKVPLSAAAQQREVRQARLCSSSPAQSRRGTATRDV